MPKTNRSVWGALLVLSAALCFSTTGMLQVIAPEGATAWANTFFRMFIGSLTLTIWSVLTGKWPSDFRNLPWKTILGCVGCLLGSQLLFFSSVKTVGVAVGTVAFIGIVPCATAIFAFLFYRRLPQKMWWISTALAVTGVVLMNGTLDVDPSQFFMVVLPIGAGFCYALYLTISPKMLQKVAPEAAMAIVFAIVSLVLLPVMFFVPLAWAVTPKGLLVVGVLGVITGGLAYSFILSGLRYTESTVASTLGLAEPLAAVCWGIFFLGEVVSLTAQVGMAMVLGSIFLLCFSLKSR